jgi:hypothetical protein
MSNGDLPARASPPEHTTNMVVTVSLGGPAGGAIGMAGGPATRPAWEWAGWKNETFAGKVRILLEKWQKVRNSNQK